MSSRPRPHDIRHRLERCGDDARRARDVIGLGYAALGAGFALPDENELTVALGQSRNTVRTGLELLREEGIIERRRGAGTFTMPEAPIDMKGLSGLGHDRAHLARAYYRTLAIAEQVLPRALAESLSVGAGGRIVLVQRLSILSETPICVWDHYIAGPWAEPAKRLFQLGDSDALVEEVLGVGEGTVDLHVEASLADRSVAQLLRLNTGQPVLRYERAVHDANGELVLIAFGYSRGAPTFHEPLANNSAQTRSET